MKAAPGRVRGQGFGDRLPRYTLVIPAQAGIHQAWLKAVGWIPACAGMTGKSEDDGEGVGMTGREWR